LRNGKISILIATVAVLFVQCGGEPPGPDAWASMQKNKMVRIATDPTNIPFEMGEGTDVQGYDVDLGNEIAKDLGQPSKWVKIPFDRLFEILKNGEVEMVISTIAISEERKKEFAFSDPYFDTGNTIARRIDNTEIKSLASLAGKKVGVQEGRSGDRFMSTQTVAANVSLVKFPTLDDALGALNRNEISAVVGYEPIITYSIYKSFSTNLIPTFEKLTQNQFAVVVRPKEAKLLVEINKTIARLKSAGSLEAWREKWFQSVMKDVKGQVEDLNKAEALKNSPKTLALNLVKASGSQVRLDRLDGFNATLIGANGSFTSTPIMTDDAGVRGGCRFSSPIPPGDYKLTLSRIQMTADVTIAKTPVTALTLTLTFTGQGSISLAWK